MKFKEHLTKIPSRSCKSINLMFKHFKLRDADFNYKLDKILPIIPLVFRYTLIIHVCASIALKDSKKYYNTKRLIKNIYHNSITPCYEDIFKNFKMLQLKTLCVVSDMSRQCKSITHLLGISFNPTFSSAPLNLLVVCIGMLALKRIITVYFRGPPRV